MNIVDIVTRERKADAECEELKQRPLKDMTAHELIALLYHLNPSRCRQPGETEEEHWRYAGGVELVTELYHMALQEVA